MKKLFENFREAMNEEEDREVQVPGYGRMMLSQIRRKLAMMLKQAAEDAAENPPSYTHLNSGVIQALHQALKENQ